MCVLNLVFKKKNKKTIATQNVILNHFLHSLSSYGLKLIQKKLIKLKQIDIIIPVKAYNYYNKYHNLTKYEEEAIWDRLHKSKTIFVVILYVMRIFLKRANPYTSHTIKKENKNDHVHQGEANCLLYKQCMCLSTKLMVPN